MNRPAQRALVVNGHNQLLKKSKLAMEIGSNFQDLVVYFNLKQKNCDGCALSGKKGVK
jgi:hypothetical protein